MRIKLLVATVLLGAAAAFTTAAPALADTTIGQAAGGVTCNAGPYTIWQPSGSASYSVPTGNWTITSWSTQAGGSGGQMAIVVVRPAGGGNDTVVAVGPTETLTPNSLNTFDVSIPVQGGDLLGLWYSGATDCYDETDDSGDAPSYVQEGKPSVGETETGTADSGYLIDISATLSPGAGAVIPQVDSVFLCYSTYEQDGGAVFPIGTAIGLLESGYWVPSAIAGNVDGGTNLGGYHLQCNPPADLKPTGQYVGGGGDVVDTTTAMNAVYGYYPIVG